MENLKCRGDAIAKKINDAMKVKAVLSDRVGKDWCLLSVPGVSGAAGGSQELLRGSECVC